MTVFDHERTVLAIDRLPYFFDSLGYRAATNALDPSAWYP